MWHLIFRDKLPVRSVPLCTAASGLDDLESPT
jgi:hypothetical protein